MNLLRPRHILSRSPFAHRLYRSHYFPYALHAPDRRISTLNHKRLLDSDLVHLFGRRVSVYDDTSQDVADISYSPARNFPDNTRGFLYFKPAPAEHPAAGSVRFRRTPGLATTFEKGHDLLTPRGEPWFIHISRVARSSRFSALAQLLIRDGYATREELERLRTTNTGDAAKTIIYATEQPFIWNLSGSLNVHVAHGERLLPLRLYSLLGDRRGGNDYNYSPFRGLVRCQFEVVNGGYEGTSLVIRVLEVLEPVRLVGGKAGSTVLIPAEGELLTRDGKPILLPIGSDTAHAPALRALVGYEPFGNAATEKGVSTLDLAKMGLREHINTYEHPVTWHPNTNLMARTLDGSLVPFSLHGNYKMQPGERHSFPQPSRGYLYFHRGDEYAPAGIRFRLCERDVPTFNGQDLRIDTNTVWCIPAELLDPSSGSQYEGLARLSIDEGWLPKDHRATPGIRTIHSLDHSFIVPFSQSVMIYYSHDQSPPVPRVFRPFADTRGVAAFGDARAEVRNPWRGSAVCRFELVRHQAGMSKVGLRIIKILERPRCMIEGYDGFVAAPSEGALVSHDWGWRAWLCTFPENTRFVPGHD